MYKQAAYEIMEKQALNTRLTHLKPLLKDLYSQGIKINRPSLDNVTKLKNLKDFLPNAMSLLGGPSAYPSKKLIMMPKLSKNPSKFTDRVRKPIDETQRAVVGSSDMFKTIAKSPEFVIAHEAGHIVDPALKGFQSRTAKGYVSELFNFNSKAPLKNRIIERGSKVMDERLRQETTANLNALSLLKKHNLISTPESRKNALNVIKANRSSYRGQKANFDIYKSMNS